MPGIGSQVVERRATSARRYPRSRVYARLLRQRMRIVTSYLWVAFGGALGSMARFWCSGLVAQTVGGTFPWGTMTVNVVGSFIIGFFGTLTGADGRLLVSPDIRTFVMVGFMGHSALYNRLIGSTTDRLVELAPCPVLVAK